MKLIEMKLSEIVENRNKPPKGYRVTVKRINVSGTSMYDSQVWRDGNMILRASGTAFEFKDKAYEIGVSRAWDIKDGKKEWS